MPVVHDKPPRYRSYLLRCWEMRSQDPERPPAWRLSIKDVRTGQEHVLDSLEGLVAFVRAELGWGGIEADEVTP